MPLGRIHRHSKRFLARKLHVNGRAMVDTQGAILMADSVEVDTRTPEEAANEYRWGGIVMNQATRRSRQTAIRLFAQEYGCRFA